MLYKSIIEEKKNHYTLCLQVTHGQFQECRSGYGGDGAYFNFLYLRCPSYPARKNKTYLTEKRHSSLWTIFLR